MILSLDARLPSEWLGHRVRPTFEHRSNYDNNVLI